MRRGGYMDYMKGYINRNKRRRSARNRTKRGHRGHRGSGYYMSRSKYGSLSGRGFSMKYAVAAGIVAAAVLVIAGIGIAMQFNRSGKQGKVASGTAAILTVREEATQSPTAAPTIDPDGVAAAIATLPTLSPDIVVTKPSRQRSKAIALTFDDGPSTKNTPKVLEMLKQYNAHATFFVVGTRVSAGADILRQEVAQGCEIANHSWSHANLSKMKMKSVNKQYNKTADLIKELVGYDITLLRPPYGAISDRMRSKLKHPMILWNVDTLDWKTKNPKKILKEVKKNVKDGDIILMHDIHPTTAESLKKVLPWLVKNDYDILTVSELAERKGAAMHNGKAYGGFSG